MNSWQRLDTKITYQNPWITVHEDSVVHPDGRPSLYGWVETPPAVFVAAIDNHDKIVLIQQTRYVTNQPSWELPAGGTEQGDPLEAAKRELLEEARLRADTWEMIEGQTYPWICFTPEYNILYVARALHEITEPLTDTDDTISQVKHVTWHQAIHMIKIGEITAGQTISALMRAGIHLGHIK